MPDTIIEFTVTGLEHVLAADATIPLSERGIPARIVFTPTLRETVAVTMSPPRTLLLDPVVGVFDSAGVLHAQDGTLGVRLAANCAALNLPPKATLGYRAEYQDTAAQLVRPFILVAPFTDITIDMSDPMYRRSDKGFVQTYGPDVVSDLLARINDKYDLPVGGVPGSDLADGAVGWAGISGKPAIIAAGANADAARVILGATTIGTGVFTAATTTAARDAIDAASEVSAKQGDSWWNTVMAAPAEQPTITMAATSQISGGTTITPTADYDYDPYFRYDGCLSVQASSGGVTSVNGSPEFVMPEIVTDAQDVEFIFRASRTGTGVVGVRCIVNDKLSSLAMQRFSTISGTDYYVKHHFAASKVRHLKLEHDGLAIFKGVVTGTRTVAQRPKGPHQRRHIAIGDSLTIGGPNMHIGAEVSGDVFYMSRECHAYYQSVLMGCDSFINLGDGGTGWGDNDVIDGPFSGRIDKALSGRPHILGFYGSRNDVGYESMVLGRVMDALARVEDVPVVLVSGPQQTLSDHVIDELVRQGVVAAGRTWLELQGAAASPGSNPTGHPTIAEQQNIAKVAHAQLDMTQVVATVEAANAAKSSVSVILTISPSSPVNVGTSVTLTATVAGNPSALLGKIQFYADGVALGPQVTVSSGTASYTTTALTAVTHVLAARFLPTNPSAVKPAMSSNTITFIVSANLGMVDTFTRADGVIGISENGRAWDNTTFTGFDIVSGSAGNTGSASTKPTYCPTDAILGTYTWKMAGTFATQAGLLLFCKNAATGGVDGSNHVFISAGGGSNNWRIWTRIANTSAAIGTAVTAPGWIAGDVITCDVTAGTTSTKFTFVVKKNGTTIITATDFDVTSILATKSGIGFSITSASNLSRIDEISMIPA